MLEIQLLRSCYAFYLSVLKNLKQVSMSVFVLHFILGVGKTNAVIHPAGHEHLKLTRHSVRKKTRIIIWKLNYCARAKWQLPKYKSNKKTFCYLFFFLFSSVLLFSFFIFFLYASNRLSLIFHRWRFVFFSRNKETSSTLYSC